jgi:hypothetical protein
MRIRDGKNSDPDPQHCPQQQSEHPYLRIISGGRIAATAVQVKAQPLHLVGMAVLLVAGHAQVEIVADRAVVACLHRLLAGVARVHKLVLTLQHTNQHSHYLKKTFR